MSRPFAEVIGSPVRQSRSPATHNFWLNRASIDAGYSATEVTREELPDYVASRRGDTDWRGCNVTMPLKEAVLPLCDRLDPVAERIGAVNTIIREADGTLAGYNTDAAGFLEPIAADLRQPHLFRMARILGTGGAARAIVNALADRNFTLVLAGRNPAKAQAILDELPQGGEHHAVCMSHFATSTDFAFDNRSQLLDLVVNASPLGMTGQPPLEFDLSHAPPGSIIYDIVTSPPLTPLLKQGAAAGFRTVDGLAMLIGQAAAAFALFFGQAPDRSGDADLRRMLTA
ncbi:shikimate dehydrogenase [Altererythrobacter sp. SALINAS58]|uniref:shikimate dehydrogenase family protein n=1 Tax=Alteripontixanthobacter muriae TaxID=2705546 RepID=UPI001576C544|nr:shikimate dehydrogenase [Alteripontixanthobacter muriae]NTZ43536.1 shikimate dehydrogenase [Alteripontixanthobacter muriae]